MDLTAGRDLFPSYILQIVILAGLRRESEVEKSRVAHAWKRVLAGLAIQDMGTTALWQQPKLGNLGI